jgi:hypothetical protein
MARIGNGEGREDDPVLRLVNGVELTSRVHRWFWLRFTGRLGLRLRLRRRLRFGLGLRRRLRLRLGLG